MWVARNLILGIAAPDYAEIRTIEKALIERDSNEGVQYVREGTNERLEQRKVTTVPAAEHCGKHR